MAWIHLAADVNETPAERMYRMQDRWEETMHVNQRDDMPKQDADREWVKTVWREWGQWEIQMWSEQGNCYVPAGYIVDNYRPYDEWKDMARPERDGFRAKLLGKDWKDAVQFDLFKHAQEWIIENNPFGIAPF
jgi:hypothetical protein